MRTPLYLWLLRLGFVVVFGWFGLQQVIEPAAWAGLIPPNISALLGVSATTLAFANGLLELAGALLLLIGWRLPWVAGLLGLHLISIIWVVGINAIGIRDTGLAFSLFALALAARPGVH